MRNAGRHSVGELCVLTVFAGLLACLPNQVIAQGLDPELAAAYDGAGVDERLGEYLPADLEFRNHEGLPVTVGELISGERPVVLNFVYFDCPMLCNVVLDSFTDTMAKMEWQAGSEFDVMTVSISPTDTPEVATVARARYAEALGRPDAMPGWHFLTGTEQNVRALADAAGFQYKWMEDVEQYVHPAVLTFVSADRKVTRYLYGIDYPVRKVRNAVVEASAGTVGTTIDRLILFCFQYDPVENAYVLRATNLMKLGGFLTIVAMALTFVILRRRERRHGFTHPAFS